MPSMAMDLVVVVMSGAIMVAMVTVVAMAITMGILDIIIQDTSITTHSSITIHSNTITHSSITTHSRFTQHMLWNPSHLSRQLSLSHLSHQLSKDHHTKTPL